MRGGAEPRRSRRRARSRRPRNRHEAFVLRARRTASRTHRHADHRAKGKLTGIAKGAKNSRRRFAGTLEPLFTSARLPPASELGPPRSSSLRVLGVFRRFPSDLERFAPAATCSSSRSHVFGRESGRDVYRRSPRYGVARRRDGDEPPCAPSSYIFSPRVATRPRSMLPDVGTPVARAETIYLAVERGGLLCRPCVPAGERCADRAGDGYELARLAQIRWPWRLPAHRCARSRGRDRRGASARAVTSGPLRSRDFLARARVEFRAPSARSASPMAPRRWRRVNLCKRRLSFPGSEIYGARFEPRLGPLASAEAQRQGRVWRAS